MKPEYISKIELEQGIFSELRFSTLTEDLVRLFDEKKLKRVYEVSSIGEKEKFIWHQLIYVTTHPFYLFFDLDTSKLIIYYKPEQLNELIIFIRIIFKQKK